MSGFSAVLAAHAARYPRMEARDWAKLAYQSQFGPAHLLDRDPAALRADLEAEWAAVDAPPPVPGPEDIGNGLCRFHLEPGADRALAAPLLARLVLRTAREHRGTMAGLEVELAALEGRDIPGLADFLARWRREGCPPVRHSEAFRAAYRPHYRLIRLSYGGYFPALLALVRLIGSGRPAVAAVDGRCGSGKTSFARLAEELLPCTVVHMDDYYLPPDRRAPNWEEIPGGNMDLERFAREVLAPARRGEAVSYRPYRCRTGTFAPARLLPAPAPDSGGGQLLPPPGSPGPVRPARLPHLLPGGAAPAAEGPGGGALLRLFRALDPPGGALPPGLPPGGGQPDGGHHPIFLNLADPMTRRPLRVSKSLCQGKSA